MYNKRHYSTIIVYKLHILSEICLIMGVNVLRGYSCSYCIITEFSSVVIHSLYKFLRYMNTDFCRLTAYSVDVLDLMVSRFAAW